MKRPGLPPGFEYKDFGDACFWEVRMPDRHGMPSDEPLPDDYFSRQSQFCYNCLSPQNGRFIYRMSTRTVTAIDWQCLSCYERSGGKGLSKNEYLKYCSVIEDRRCRSCFGYGCYKCQENKCAYKGCEHPYQNVHAHHSSPRQMFEDANNWPLIPYCEVHHRIWHKTMNSNTH